MFLWQKSHPNWKNCKILFFNNGISADHILKNDVIRTIKGYADSVKDYRHPSYTRHLPGDIIMIVFFAILGNANEWGEIETFARKKEKWLQKYLELPNGIPTDDTDWYSEKKEWKRLKSFGLVHKTLKRADGSVATEDRYYICSIEADAELFERAARGHWGVEIMHWQLDFTFLDDKNTSMARTSARNLQIMKKIVMSILRLVKESYKLSMKRIRYELSLDYENGVEKMLSMLSVDSIEKALEAEKSM